MKWGVILLLSCMMTGAVRLPEAQEGVKMEVIPAEEVQEPQRGAQSVRGGFTIDEIFAAKKNLGRKAYEKMDAAKEEETKKDGEDPEDGSETVMGSISGGSDQVSDPEAVNLRLWGVCTLSFYCPCSRCCGSWAGGPTASGVMPSAGRTVACDLPFGTRLMIEGNEYVVEDRGVSGMWVDIFVNDHQEALNRGMYQAEVYIIE